MYGTCIPPPENELNSPFHIQYTSSVVGATGKENTNSWNTFKNFYAVANQHAGRYGQSVYTTGIWGGIGSLQGMTSGQWLNSLRNRVFASYEPSVPIPTYAYNIWRYEFQ